MFKNESSKSLNRKKTRAHVISIVSGKGGTGKTLLTAVLGRALAKEGLKVLLIDFDIFVRGLTILLEKYLEEGLITEGGITISDLLLSKRSREDIRESELATFRFFECDVIPACSKVSMPLNYDSDRLSSLQFTQQVVENLLSVVADQYDIILIDNRASIDSLTIAVCQNSDVVLSVSEDDDLCAQANSNLIDHLRHFEGVQSLYTIINKGRRITSYGELEEQNNRLPGYNYTGVMPFDIEIMEDFGKDRFWFTVYETLYFRALIDAWNTLAKMERLTAITLAKYTFPSRIFMSKRAGRFTTGERMMRIYGIMLTFAGIFAFLYGRYLTHQFSLSDSLSIMLVIIGIFALILGSSDIRRYLLGGEDRPRSSAR